MLEKNQDLTPVTRGWPLTQFMGSEAIHVLASYDYTTAYVGKFILLVKMIIKPLWPKWPRCTWGVCLFLKTFLVGKQVIGDLVSWCIVIQQMYLSMPDENLLLEIGKFSDVTHIIVTKD